MVNASISAQDTRTAPPEAVPLSEILGALSHAIDLTEGQPPGHCVRCCWIGVHIGRALGLDDAAMDDLYYAILLKDLGCSSNAARICQLYLSDDIGFKRDFKTVGSGLPQVLGFVLSHTGLQSSLAERFRAVLNIVRNGGEIAQELIETRCQRGADIARRLRFSEAVAQAIQALDEHWDGNGQPAGLTGEAIPLFARIALLSQVVDVFHTGGGPEAALKEVRGRSGTWFDPQVVAALERVAADPAFWATLASDEVEQAIFRLEPARRDTVPDESYLDDIAEAFADIVDAKSPYTRGHSDRVAFYTEQIALELGLDGARTRRLKRAALLHDVGKLGVSNQILDKPGKLDEEEWVAMRSHAALSETILSRIGAFEDLARIGGAHHERLDGRGYPRGLTGESIELGTRIVTVADVFDALTAARPYRGPMPAEKALEIMEKEEGRAFDPECMDALRRVLARG
ncbi:HD-GYP domain-containing protein [Azospirillum canadense]|uniref:HD-GYP domain-containing protein n=1 Tax=Azospirillum canadense TaxID=403962 RepID=UPI002225BE63|nr:HD-GYP domain-containing protein [Azospirillum canadense]MCW2242878.1 putative nucleotidyltransferase with HDIG domain [Azospirillum canadense]